MKLALIQLGRTGVQDNSLQHTVIGRISPNNVESSKKAKICFVMNDRVLKGSEVYLTGVCTIIM